VLLELESVDSFYGDFQALFGVTIDVAEGETPAQASRRCWPPRPG
jgi:ABC-type arginine transport system ATPase subunit